MIRWFKQIIAKRELAKDQERRKQLIGQPYAKRRAAALKGLRRAA